jgi:hypothetical protein
VAIQWWRVHNSRVTVCHGLYLPAQMQVMTSLSNLGQTFMACLLLESRYSGRAECLMSSVAARVSSFWKSRPGSAVVAAANGASDTVPSASLFMVLRELEAARLVLVGDRACRWGCLITLNVPSDDVLHVLQQSSRLAWLHNALGVAA